MKSRNNRKGLWGELLLEQTELIEYMKNAIDYDDELLEFCRQSNAFGTGERVKLSDFVDYKSLVAMAFEYAKFEYIVTDKDNCGEVYATKDLVRANYSVDEDDLLLVAILCYVQDFVEQIIAYKKSKGIAFDMIEYSLDGVEKFGTDFLVLLRDLAFMYRFNSLAKIDETDAAKLYFTRDESLSMVVDSDDNLNNLKENIGDAYFVIPKNFGDRIGVFDFIRWK